METKVTTNETRKIWTYDVNSQIFGVKKCLKVEKKDGTFFYVPIKEKNVHLCFTDMDGHVLGEVAEDGGSYTYQLLVYLAEREKARFNKNKKEEN